MSTRPPSSSGVALLDEIAASALEPGYLRAAQRRTAADDHAGRHEPARSRRRRSLHLGLTAVLVIAGFVLALTVADVRRNAPQAARDREVLAERVQDRTAATDALSDQVRALRDDVAAARDEELATTRAGRAKAAELAALELETGAVTAEGPGVRVTVDDAPARPDDGPDLGKVQDRDLQLVVNGLWAAGAEAVAVNGYRLTSRSAIRTAGESVLVDLRPVSPPYVVEAIGDPDTLRARFVEGPGGRTLSTLGATYGIRFGTESVNRLRLPAAASLGGVGSAARGGTP